MTTRELYSSIGVSGGRIRDLSGICVIEAGLGQDP